MEISGIVKKKKVVFIMDQLSNSMEHFGSKHQFVSYITKETGLTNREISALYDKWWELKIEDRNMLPFAVDQFGAWVSITIIGAYGSI